MEVAEDNVLNTTLEETQEQLVVRDANEQNNDTYYHQVSHIKVQAEIPEAFV